jgi:hypothetical protein
MPNASVPTDDPLVRFSTGARTVDFFIPANSTNVTLSSRALLLTGTVAGVIRVMASIGGAPSDVMLGTTVVRAVAPQLTNIVAVPSATGFDIQVTGYAPDRRIVSAEFTFDVRTANGIQKVTLTRNVEGEFTQWYRSQNSTVFGSTFNYTQSFSVQGDLTAIEAVSVTLSNAQGAATTGPISLRLR